MITRSQALRRHRQMWRWLAENPGKYKWGWPGWSENGGPYDYGDGCHYCHLCYFTNCDCSLCPVNWGAGKEFIKCTEDGSMYVNWMQGLSDASSTAKQIAELPRRRL